MANIGPIITKYRTRLEAAGLLRQTTAPKLSPQVAAMRPSLTKARLALQERPPIIQVSPMAILFETTLPKLEPVLVDLGEARAEEIIDRLCEHGKEMIAEHGIEGSKEHLEELFKDLPDYEGRLKEEEGVEGIIEAYSGLYLEESYEGYLRLKFGDKIVELKTHDNGMISLEMSKETEDSDLIPLRKVANLQSLNLKKTQVSDAGLAHLAGLANLQYLGLWGTQITDVGLERLKGLINLQGLYLNHTQVTDAGLAYLAGLTNLQYLGLWGTQITDAGLEHLKGLIDLDQLVLADTQITDAGLRHLKGLINLDRLHLLGTQVTAAGVRELKRAIPELKTDK